MGGSSADRVAVVLLALGKCLVGELVELGRDVMQQWGDGGADGEGPLRPRHIHEAARRLVAEGVIPPPRPERAFRR